MIKKIFIPLTVWALLVLPSMALAQVTTHAGGTGLVDISSGSILFGSVFNIRLATSSAFQFNNTASRLTVTYASTTALTSTNLAATNATSSNLTLTGGAANCNGTSALTTTSTGVVSCTAQPQGTVTSVTATYPILSTGGVTPVISTAFGTTTANIFSNLNTFNGGILVVGSSTIVGNATTTGTFFAGIASSTNLFGANLASCNSASNALTWNAGIFGCNTIASSAFSYPFPAGATSTPLMLLASTTIGNGTVTGGLTVSGTATTSNFIDISMTSALALFDANHKEGAYGGAGACSANNWVTTISAVGGSTCGTIGANGLTLSMFPTIAANTVIGNLTGGTATPTAFATSSLFFGTAGQTAFFSGTGALVGTSSIFTSPASFIGIGSTTPFSRLSMGNGTASSSITVAEVKYGTSFNGIATSTNDVDCNASTQIAWPMGTGAVTLTLINLTPGKTCRVVVQNPNATAGAITWAIRGGILKWAGGTAPTQTLTANAMDVWSFLGTAGSSTMQVNGAQSANF